MTADDAMKVFAAWQTRTDYDPTAVRHQVMLALDLEVRRLRDAVRALEGLGVVLRAKAAEAKLARIESLADEWSVGKGLATVGFASALRLALQGDDQRTSGPYVEET